MRTDRTITFAAFRQKLTDSVLFLGDFGTSDSEGLSWSTSNSHRHMAVETSPLRPQIEHVMCRVDAPPLRFRTSDSSTSLSGKEIKFGERVDLLQI